MGACSSIGMLKRYMVRWRLGTPVLSEAASHEIRAGFFQRVRGGRGGGTSLGSQCVLR